MKEVFLMDYFELVFLSVVFVPLLDMSGRSIWTCVRMNIVTIVIGTGPIGVAR